MKMKSEKLNIMQHSTTVRRRTSGFSKSRISVRWYYCCVISGHCRSKV